MCNCVVIREPHDPPELLRAQFGVFADTYSFDVRKRLKDGRERPLSKADKVRLIGNSVAPDVAAAVVAANAAEIIRQAGAA